MTIESYYQRGESLDYKNSGTDKIAAGTILKIGTHIGIAGGDINPGELGSIAVTGVYKIHKKDAAEIKQGTDVYLDEDGITATKGTTSAAAGYAAADSAADETTVLVKIG